MSGGKQVIPPSITGKGAVHAGSVLDHAFGSSPPYTLGVEEEYMLLDGETFDLVQHIDSVLAAVSGHELAHRINAELMQSVLEIATPVCRTPADVLRELSTLRAYVQGVAHEQGLRVGSAGTHPFSLFERQRITANDRYRRLVEHLQYIARRELIFGMHVHVAVDGPDKAIAVTNALAPHLAELLALSASSPFWRGQPTGLQSSRQMVFSAFPRSGVPPRFSRASTTMSRAAPASYTIAKPPAGLTGSKIRSPPVARKSVVATSSRSASLTLAPCGLSSATLIIPPRHVTRTRTPARPTRGAPARSCASRMVRSSPPVSRNATTRLSNGITSNTAP